MSRFTSWSVFAGVITGFACIAGAAESLSPIMSLEEVIGIEVKKATLADRTSGQGLKTDLMRDDGERSEFPLVRLFDLNSVDFDSVQARSEKGKWMPGITISPRDQKRPPGLLLLDEELRYVEAPMGSASEDADNFLAEQRRYGEAPLGSYLVGAGYAVLFPREDLLERRRSFSLGDWIKLIERFVEKERVDKESLFLVATQEHAELALRLAANIPFAGIVLEAPRHMLFKDQNKQKGAEPNTLTEEEKIALAPFTSREQIKRYVGFSAAQKGPMLLVLEKNDPSFDKAQKSLLLSLVNTNADFSVVALDGLARRQREPDEKGQNPYENNPDFDESVDYETTAGADLQEVHPPLGFIYDEGVFEVWVRRMLQFLDANSVTKAVPILLPPANQNGQREIKRMNNFMDSFGVQDSSTTEVDTGESDSE